MIVATGGRPAKYARIQSPSATTIRTTRSSGPIFLLIAAYPFSCAEALLFAVAEPTDTTAALILPRPMDAAHQHRVQWDLNVQTQTPGSASDPGALRDDCSSAPLDVSLPASPVAFSVPEPDPRASAFGREVVGSAKPDCHCSNWKCVPFVTPLCRRSHRRGAVASAHE